MYIENHENIHQIQLFCKGGGDQKSIPPRFPEMRHNASIGGQAQIPIKILASPLADSHLSVNGHEKLKPIPDYTPTVLAFHSLISDA